MSKIEVSYSVELEFEPHKIYQLFADYKEGHPSILPRTYFEKLTVEQGGYGAGTVVSVKMTPMGGNRTLRMIVSEPEPGRVLQESDNTLGIVTQFIVDPLPGGKSSRVTITTSADAPPGLRGKIEKWLSPYLLKTIYRAELKQVQQHLNWKQVGKMGIYS